MDKSYNSYWSTVEAIITDGATGIIDFKNLTHTQGLGLWLSHGAPA